MRTKFSTYILAIAALGTTLTAQAHDPKEHMKDAEAPNCASMHNMEHGKMDMDDPIMVAMMQQCMDEMHGDKNQATEEAEKEMAESESMHEHSEHHH